MPTFWRWFYSQGARNAFNIYQSIIILTYRTFSIEELARTLFAPWKRDVVAPVETDVKKLLQAFGFNMVSRLIGFFIRTVVIVLGLTASLLTAFIGAFLLLAYLGLPLTSVVLVAAGAVIVTNQTTAFLILGVLLIAAGAGVWLLAWQSYKTQRWLDPPPKINLQKALAGGLSLEPLLSRRAAYYLQKTDPNEINSLKAALASAPQVKFILAKATVAPSEFLKQTGAQLSFQQILREAAAAAAKESRSLISLGDLVLAVFKLDPALNNLLTNKDLNIEDLSHICDWQRNFWSLVEPVSPLLTPAKLKTNGGIGKNWASGYTNQLDRYSRDLTEYVHSPNWDHKFLAHAKSIDELERVLARTAKHNLLLVGEPGVGKRTLVMGFARRVLVGKTLPPLAHKKLVELDVTALLASSETPQKLEYNLTKILDEAVRAGNIILFIDEIERLFNPSGDLGVVNAAELLSPYLQSAGLQLIGAITPAEYHSTIERKPSLHDQFETIELNEPSEAETIRILQEIAPFIEGKYRVTVSYQAIKQIVVQAKRYLAQRRFPEKGVELLDEVAVEVSSRSSSRFITPKEVDMVVSQKANVPVGQASADERQSLLNMEELMHRYIVNQTQAITKISEALRRSRAGVGSTKKPVGSFLFLGPTGVGKTETAKTLARIEFGNEKQMIRLDMSEYQELSSIKRLIGDEAAMRGGVLTDKIRETPFSVVLLDEIEKANRQILDLFLQVVDEGRLTDALGQLADFRNSIIIATSNAGANLIRQRIQQQPNRIDMNALSKELLEFIQNQGIFRPEFLNRFDAVVAYRPLLQEELLMVVDRQLDILNKRIKDKQIKVSLTEGARQKIAQLGFDPAFGARALVRTMTDKVENLLAKAILANQVQKGSVFKIDEKMIQ